MWSKFRLSYIISGMLVILIIAALSSPLLIEIYSIQRGGRLLSQALVTIPGSDTSPSVCDLSVPPDYLATSLLENARKALENAIHYNPRLSQAFLLLGRVYCLLGEREEAVKSFTTYTRLRPENPLGFIELGSAYAASCLNKDHYSSINDQFCNQSDVVSEFWQAWQSAGINSAQFPNYAEIAFENQNFKDAELYFKYAFEFGLNRQDEASFPELFKWAITAVISGRLVSQALDDVLPVFHLDGPQEIPATKLRWALSIPAWNVEYGDNLTSHPSGQEINGMMYWAGRAIAFVKAEQAGNYRIIVRAQDMPPAPTILQLDLDLTPIGKIELTDGDGKYKEFTYITHLTAKTHLVGLNFVNDGVSKGIDRNANLSWIRVEAVVQANGDK